MDTNYTQFPDKFIPYEMNRISCDFVDEQHFLGALHALKLSDFDSTTYYVLQGVDGLRALDPTGLEHGVIAMMKRKLHALLSDAEQHSIEDMVKDLEAGMIHLSVPALHKKQRRLIHDIMDEFDGRKIKYMGFFTVEEYV